MPIESRQLSPVSLITLPGVKSVVSPLIGQHHGQIRQRGFQQ